MNRDTTPFSHLPDPPAPPQPAPLLSAVVTSAGFGALSGAIAGFVWGGIGGRIAMRVAFLTSPERVGGLVSDDGFEIGVISAATVFLLIFTSIAGGMAGFGYGMVRIFLRGPTWLIAAGVGVAVALGIGGGGVIRAEGIDFRLLEPLGLLVGMFLFLPGAWGVTVVVLTDRLVKKQLPHLPTAVRDRRWRALDSAVVWLLLGLMAVFGFRDLVQDIERLT